MCVGVGGYIVSPINDDSINTHVHNRTIIRGAKYTQIPAIYGRQNSYIYNIEYVRTIYNTTEYL